MTIIMIHHHEPPPPPGLVISGTLPTSLAHPSIEGRPPHVSLRLWYHMSIWTRMIQRIHASLYVYATRHPAGLNLHHSSMNLALDPRTSLFDQEVASGGFNDSKGPDPTTIESRAALPRLELSPLTACPTPATRVASFQPARVSSPSGESEQTPSAGACRLGLRVSPQFAEKRPYPRPYRVGAWEVRGDTQGEESVRGVGGVTGNLDYLTPGHAARSGRRSPG